LANHVIGPALAAADQVFALGDLAAVQLTLLWTVNPSAQLRDQLVAGRTGGNQAAQQG
jgi:hypothetical protein